MTEEFPNRPKSSRYFDEAQNLLVGGVNSPARTYPRGLGPPPFIKKADGPYLVDEDDNRYIDFVSSWGAILFGHNPQPVKDALQEQVGRGTSYGAPTHQETELARLIVEMVPSIEKLRLVNSGTEATMSALRLARGYTGQDLILKFTGCYHGHSDSLLVEAGSGGATLATPDSAGVPAELAAMTLVASYGDENELEEIFNRYGQKLGAVIIEPVAGNMGLIVPPASYLKKLRKLTRESETLLIFDEVMTGFRVGPGGVQEEFDIIPDLTCLGKVVGGGLPVGVFGGNKEIMSHLAPEGDVYQAGTLSGNPLAVRAGVETLKLIKNKEPFAQLDKIRKHIENSFQRSAQKADIPLQFQGLGGMFSYFFSEEKVTNYRKAAATDQELFNSFHRQALEKGLYFPPSPFESCFLNTELKGEVLKEAGRKIEEIINNLRV